MSTPSELERRLAELCLSTYSDVGMYPHPMLDFARNAARIGAELEREEIAAYYENLPPDDHSPAGIARKVRARGGAK